MTGTQAPPANSQGNKPGAKPKGQQGRGQDGIPPVRGLLPLLILVVIWELAGNKHSAYYAPPGRWIPGLQPLWPGTLLSGIGQTALTWIEALVIATALGTVLGVAIGRNRLWDRTLGPFLEFCRVMPIAAIVPIVVLIAGYTVRMQLAVVVLGAIWPVLLGVRSAAQRIRPQLVDLGRSVGLSRLETVRKIIFPSVIPGILSGVRISAPITLVTVLLVEILTQIGGLGALMGTAQQNFDSAQLYGLVCIVGIMGLIAGWGVSYLSRRAERYWSGT
jgi:ABC-type nitrate/sulfonate/bicarbonate transport system permease component